MANATRNQKISRAMRLAWREANIICFDGKLSRPAFRVRDLSKNTSQALWEAAWNGTRETLSIDPKYCTSATKVICLILHEMIHQLQYLQKSDRTKKEHHGRFFLRHVARIKNITGWNVL